MPIRGIKLEDENKQLKQKASIVVASHYVGCLGPICLQVATIHRIFISLHQSASSSLCRSASSSLCVNLLRFPSAASSSSRLWGAAQCQRSCDWLLLVLDLHLSNFANKAFEPCVCYWSVCCSSISLLYAEV